MDNKKDIEETYGQKEISSVYKKDVSPIDFFSKDQSFVFVYKKTEKLATALYMVTNLFGDSEPMKWTLRTKVSGLLSFILGFKDILKSREEEFTNEVKTRILEIVSLLEIAFRSGLVSSMNFSILKSEFIHLANFLSELKKEGGHRTDLKENFFEIPAMPARVVNNKDFESDYKRQTNVLERPKKTNRQNIIINLLKRNQEITINDITVTISDCSEKTIQRELIALIEAGIVKKTGERRWSKYSLV